MNSKLSRDIKAEALRLGFFACGIAETTAVDEPTSAHLLRWINDGGNADMTYMGGNTDKRLDPRLLMKGVKSIVSVALNYAPSKRIPDGELQFAAYAYGHDYHQVVKDMLWKLSANLGFKAYNEGEDEADDGEIHFRAFCDTAPILERYWAVKAGIGWTGRNHQLIIPRAGSMFFLGELFLDVEVGYDEPQQSRCAGCRKCIDACPTGALSADKEIDSAKCLSYQTIENRGELSPEAVLKMGDTIYGCDRCLQVCPWNRYAVPNVTPELQPSADFLAMSRDRWSNLTEDDYRRLFKGSAVKRAKYSGLMRNIKASEKNKI
jgi:epoxyqueuosine reductase